MKSYKKAILASLASAAILSAYSVEVEAAEIPVVDSETEQVQEVTFEEPQELNEAIRVINETTETSDGIIEEVENADATNETTDSFVDIEDAENVELAEDVEIFEVADNTEIVADDEVVETEQPSAVTVENVEATEIAEGTSVTEQTYADNLERANNPEYQEENLTADDGGQYDAEGNLVGLTIGGETAEVTQEKPEVLPAPVNDTPNRITTNLSETPESSILFQWHTTTPDSDARLYIWEESQSPSDAVALVPEMVSIEDAFHIQTTPDGYYVYAVLEGFDSSDSNPFRAVDGSDMPIGYYTDEVFTVGNIQWLDKGYDNWSVALPYEQFAETAYRVEASNLNASTTYLYQMGNPATGLVSEVGKFTTASTNDDPFSFIHYTDTQAAFSSDNQRPEWAYSKDALESAIGVAPEASFAIHTGDVVNDQWNDTEWLKTLEAIEVLNQEMPHMYVTGNHDRENFLTHINTPSAIEGMESGVAYSLDYNGVHFVVLNTEHDRDRAEGEEEKAILDSQMQWLRDDLAQAVAAREAGHINWIIASYHRPLFSSSYHSLEDESVQLIRDELMQILDEYDVDLVLNGHDHNLTVTQPLVHDASAFGNARVVNSTVITENGVTTYYNPEGTVFFIPNTAGTKTYEAIYKNKTIDWILEHEDIDTTYEELFGYTVTADDLEYFRTLLLTEDQPFRSSYYAGGHSNAREGNIQHYAVVDVTPETITYSLYEVVGEDLEIEGGRETNLIHTYVLTKTQPVPQEDFTDVEDMDTEQPDTDEVVEVDDLENSETDSDEIVAADDTETNQFGSEEDINTNIVGATRSGSEELLATDNGETERTEHIERTNNEDAEVNLTTALPKTGTASTSISTVLGLLLSGLGFSLFKRKDD